MAFWFRSEDGLNGSRPGKVVGLKRTAQWRESERVLPCHTIDPDDEDVRAFGRCPEEARARSERLPHALATGPGEVMRVRGA